MATRTGTNKRDILKGTTGDDLMYGRDGDDDLDGLGGSDTMNGGLGADLLSGRLGDDILNGNDGNDILFGDAGADTLNGGAGRDFLAPGNDTEIDAMDGGTGMDTVSYFNADATVYVDLINNVLLDDAANDTITDVENVIGGDFADHIDVGFGGFAYGGKGDDTLIGHGAGVGALFGARLRGDAGNDYLGLTNGECQVWLQKRKDMDTLDGFTEDEDGFFIDLSEFRLGRRLEANEVTNSADGLARGRHAQFIYDHGDKVLSFDPDGRGGRASWNIAYFNAAVILDSELDFRDFDYML